MSIQASSSIRPSRLEYDPPSKTVTSSLLSDQLVSSSSLSSSKERENRIPSHVVGAELKVGMDDGNPLGIVDGDTDGNTVGDRDKVGNSDG